MDVANPPLPQREQPRGKKRWHKPTLYDMTEYVDTAGAPTLKPWAGDPGSQENEHGNPGVTQFKNYRPATAPV